MPESVRINRKAHERRAVRSVGLSDLEDRGFVSGFRHLTSDHDLLMLPLLEEVPTEMDAGTGLPLFMLDLDALDGDHPLA